MRFAAPQIRSTYGGVFGDESLIVNRKVLRSSYLLPRRFHQVYVCTRKMATKFKIELKNLKTRAFDKMAASDEYLDVKLGADGETMNVHRAVLAAVSPYFDDLFCSYKGEENPICT